MKELSYLINFLLDCELDDRFETHKETMQRLEDENFDKLDKRKLSIVADRFKKVGDHIYDEIKADTAEQLELTGEEEICGNKVTTVTREYYSYPEDDKQLQIYQQDIDEYKSQISEIKDQMKPLKDGIKARKEQLELNGEAELSSVSKYISISRK